jgi:hypothetical protein
MENNQQKKIMFYSVGHTGTHFLNDLIESSVAKNKIVRAEAYVLKKIGVEAREKYTLEKYIELSTALIPLAKLKEAELVTFWSHIYAPGSVLLKSITRDKPLISCVSPMRDPLLRLNTNMFWNRKYNINAELRLKQIKKTVKMFIEILSIPDEHRFLFPVDLHHAEKDIKEKNYKKLFEFCSLKPRKETEDFFNKWKPAHETKTHPANPKNTKKRNIFEINKTAILNKDIDTLKKTMSPEFLYLQKQEGLKRKLEQYGYKNLVWW